MSRYCPMRKVLCNIEKSSFLFSFSLASYRLSELRIKKFLRLNKKEKVWRIVADLNDDKMLSSKIQVKKTTVF